MLPLHHDLARVVAPVASAVRQTFLGLLSVARGGVEPPPPPYQNDVLPLHHRAKSGWSESNRPARGPRPRGAPLPNIPSNAPHGIRTRIAGLKGRDPGPLDERGVSASGPGGARILVCGASNRRYTVSATSPHIDHGRHSVAVRKWGQAPCVLERPARAPSITGSQSPFPDGPIVCRATKKPDVGGRRRARERVHSVQGSPRSLIGSGSFAGRPANAPFRFRQADFPGSGVVMMAPERFLR